jgi:hypothetical protein
MRRGFCGFYYGERSSVLDFFDFHGTFILGNKRINPLDLEGREGFVDSPRAFVSSLLTGEGLGV